jgi:hypothetical protein
MDDKQNMYNTVFSLIEEELHQRMNPSGYNNNRYDGTNLSICGSSNIDISTLNEHNNNMFGGSKIINYIPGKFETVRHSYHVPLNIAIKGSISRQKQYIVENKSTLSK